jgi:hypothetical protein
MTVKLGDFLGAGRARYRMRRLHRLVGNERLLCSICRGPIATYTLENDYVCAEHGFVDAICERDGTVLSGNGEEGPPRIIGHVVV